MSEVCLKCGLPKELCVCESIAKQNQVITIKTENKKFKKVYTIIAGLDEKEIDLKELAKTLKNKLACGGTFKEGKIELQGDHRQKAKMILLGEGFAPETIQIR
ncbi:MAG TPA: translation initiation factor [Candidatus Nanoarchaeia archaeon]|nr:translation initiation factor [Candidatus Nanoarchaeia archaeon]